MKSHCSQSFMGISLTVLGIHALLTQHIENNNRYPSNMLTVIVQLNKPLNTIIYTHYSRTIKIEHMQGIITVYYGQDIYKTYLDKNPTPIEIHEDMERLINDFSRYMLDGHVDNPLFHI